MTEKTKAEELEESIEGSYYYDDATGYELFDPDAPEEEENQVDESDEIRVPGSEESTKPRTFRTS